jgi:chemotaxis protein methyltransferase CheR
MNDVLMQQFIQLISTNTGLHIREQDRDSLRKKIYGRMKLLKLSVPQQYYQLLKTGNEQSNSPQGTLSQHEWRELVLLLTTGETFFFRDLGQITLLKNRILPELIEQKKARYAAGEAKPSLRIWSAGCSTGEEPHSLAILVKELIPDLDKWDILILGTDINQESIEKAKRGIYDSWSFRMVKPEVQRRYFYQRKTNWEIDEQIRRMVTFRSGNLLKDRFPSPTSDIHSMDIILCRNVFIYFDSKAISVVLEKFHNTLRRGGYLIAGHTELHGQNLGQLQAKVFPESVVYQRSKDLQVETPLAAKFPISCRVSKTLPSRPDNASVDTALIPPTTPVSPSFAPSRIVTSPSPSTSLVTKQNLMETTSPTELGQAEILLHNGAYASAIKEAEQVLKQHPHHFEAYYLIAQACANLGECEQAIHYCQQALKVDSLSLKPYYLLAHIAEDGGNVQKAKDLFKKIIYLAPSSVPAYLELGSLYESEGDKTRSRKMRNTAFELLKKLPPHAAVEHQGEVTAGELLLHVKKLLSDRA